MLPIHEGKISSADHFGAKENNCHWIESSHFYEEDAKYFDKDVASLLLMGPTRSPARPLVEFGIKENTESNHCPN
jgi:hypothetical protein